MDAKELMIGDLILCDDKIPMRVAHTDRHLKIWVDSYDREKYPHYGYGTCERYTPIPITAEILEKNLEKECEDTIDGGWYFNAENSRIWGILDDKGFWLNFNGQQDMILIHYVHQLQHALRLCGLNDFADNFVI